MSKTLEYDLTEGSVWKKLIQFAWPLFLANLLQTFYSMVDMLVVGQFVGSVGISAVSVGGQISFVMLVVGMGFVNGGQVIVSQLKGGSDKEGQKQVIGTLFSVCAVAGVVMAAVGVMLLDPAIRWMNTPAEAVEQARDYMLWTSLGTIFVYEYNAISAVLRGLGDATRPLIFVAIASVINIILDIIFVGPLNMGAGGAAIATVASQALSAAFGFVFLYRRRTEFVFDFRVKSFAVRKKWLKELTRIGVPQMIQFSGICLSLSYMTALVNAYGLAASATLGVGNKISNMLGMPYMAVSTASTAMAGQSAGAGKLDRIKKIVETALLLNFVILAFSSIMTFAFSRQMVRVFDSNPEVIELGSQFLKIQILCYLGHTMFCAYNAACLGVGNATLSTIAFLTDGVLVRISLCVLFTYVFGFGLSGLFWASGIAPLSCGVILGAYYYSGKWKTFNKGTLKELREAKQSIAVSD